MGTNPKTTTAPRSAGVLIPVVKWLPAVLIAVAIVWLWVAGDLSAEPNPSVRPGVAFDGQQAEAFTPAAMAEVEMEQEEGRLEGMVSVALRPRRSLWRRIAGAGLALDRCQPKRQRKRDQQDHRRRHNPARPPTDRSRNGHKTADEHSFTDIMAQDHQRQRFSALG